MLPIFSYFVLRNKGVQTYITHKITNYLSEELKTDIKVGSIDITYFLDIVLEDVSVNDLHKNKLLETKRILIDFGDYSIKKRSLKFNKVRIEKALFALRYYKGEKENNLNFIINYFATSDTSKSKPWKIIVNSLKIVNSQFIFQNNNEQFEKEGIDYFNLHLTGLNLDLRKISLKGDTIIAQIKELSFKERCGFYLKDFKSDIIMSDKFLDASNLYIETPTSKLKLKLKFNYDNYSAYTDFVNKIDIESKIETSRFDLKDLIYFVPAIKGMNNKLEISCKIKGFVRDFKITNFKILFGELTRFYGDLSMKGLPNFEKTLCELNINELVTTKVDFERFNLLSSISKLKVDNKFNNLGKIIITGNYKGYMDDFAVNIDVITDIGRLGTELELKYNNTKKTYNYTGSILCNNFNLGKLISQQKTLGEINIKANIVGESFSVENAKLNVDGNINSIVYNNYTYKNINLKGAFKNKRFNGSVVINDKNLDLNFEGIVDLQNKLPKFNFEASINKANLSNLNIIDKDSVEFTSLIDADFSGNDIDNLNGTISITKTKYSLGNSKFAIREIVINNYAEENGEKNISLKSDLVDADISGIFFFKDIEKSFYKFLYDYIPAYRNKSISDKNNISEQKIKFKFFLKNVQPLCYLISPDFKIANNSIFEGNYFSLNNSFDFSFNTKAIDYKSQHLLNFSMEGKTEKNTIYVNLNSQKVNFNDSLYIENFKIKNIVKGDSLNYNILWQNSNKFIKNAGDISGIIVFNKNSEIKLIMNESSIILNDSAWTINKNRIVYDTNSIHFDNVIIKHKDQSLIIDGIIAGNINKNLKIYFNNFNISNFDIFTNKMGFDFDGILNGNANISNLYNSPNILSNLNISGFCFNKDKLGELNLNSSWDNDKQAISVDCEVVYKGNIGSNKPLIVKGFYYPNRKNNNYNLEINLENYKLGSLAHYLKSFCSEFNGIAFGKIKMTGKTAEPELNGVLKLMKTKFKIDYLNTEYIFTNDIKIQNNNFIFEDLKLTDKYGTGICNGKVTHKNFSDFKFDITLNLDHLQCLNTNFSQNNLYYGKAILSGLVNIKGDEKNINLDISARTIKGTDVTIPITSDNEITENNFISFTKKSIIKKVQKTATDLSGIKLAFSLDLTPDAVVRIPFQSFIGGGITAYGSGNIKLEINSATDFNMFGNFTIDRGNYLFVWKNIINKDFKIMKGGIIKWKGNPYDAEIAIGAKYRLDAKLKDLLVEQSEKYNKTIPVECIINLDGKLFNSNIGFEINLPNSDEDTKNIVKNLINTEQEVTNQVISLLAFGRFFPTMINQYNNPINSSIAGTKSMELLSNQINNWLSHLSKKVEIGVNYKQGDQLNRDEVEVALKTELLNEKVSIDGNIGVASGSGSTSSNQNASNVVGDVNVEVKIDKEGNFRMKAYNKSNTYDLLSNNGPYTQGVGIFYRKEYNSLSEFFRKNKKKNIFK